MTNKTNRNNSHNLERKSCENKSIEQATNVNEFAGHTYQNCPHKTENMKSNYTSRNKNNGIK